MTRYLRAGLSAVCCLAFVPLSYVIASAAAGAGRRRHGARSLVVLLSYPASAPALSPTSTNRTALGGKEGGGSGWWWAYSTHDGTSMGQEKGPPPTFAPAPRLCIKRRDGSAASTRPTNTSPSDYQARLILRHAWGMGLGSAKTANRRPWRSGQTAKVTNYLN